MRTAVRLGCRALIQWVKISEVGAFENVQRSTEGLSPEQQALACVEVCPNACGPVMSAGSQPYSYT